MNHDDTLPHEQAGEKRPAYIQVPVIPVNVTPAWVLKNPHLESLYEAHPPVERVALPLSKSLGAVPAPQPYIFADPVLFGLGRR